MSDYCNMTKNIFFKEVLLWMEKNNKHVVKNGTVHVHVKFSYSLFSTIF